MAEGHFRVDPDARAAAVAAMAAMPRTSHFANARAVRNLVDEIRMRQAERLAAEGDADLDRIVRSDVPFRDRRPSLSRKRARVAAALDRLEAMPGLAPVKHHVRSLVDLAEVEAARRAKGRPPVAPPGHLALVGNPGTGKTTVARLVADLYGGLGLLSSGHVLEVGRKDLVHGFGGSAARVGAAAAAARGGVLLIDEAYALSLGQADLPGQEAVDALVDVMENQRDDLVVILTGYRHRIDELLESNPGLRSRVSEVLDFPDYDGETCAQIFHRFVADARLSYAEGAQSMVEVAMMLLPFEPDFANARSVREAFEATVRRQAARLVAQRAEAGGRPGEGWSGIEGGSQVLTVLTADDIAGG
jgi:SpoVK/Ycf46/Vps4 family AAA+-type ATPase